jgi:hypothetical protein
VNPPAARVIQRLALVGACLLLASAARAQGLDERVPAKTGGALQVDLDFGEEGAWERVSLEVRSHDADEVWAVADLSGLAASSAVFRLDHDDRGVRLYGRTGGLLPWLLGGPAVAVRVWVPREFSADLRCSSGPIRVEELTGEVRARTAGSSIEVRGVTGPLKLRTDGGAIRASEVTGDVAVRSTGGGIELRWISGDVEVTSDEGDVRLSHVTGNVEVRAEAGEITLADVRGRAEVQAEQGAISASFSDAPAGSFESRSGSIEVLLPARAGAALEARSAQGSVLVDADVAPEGQRGANHFVGRVNGGGAALRIFTARGNVRVAAR